MRGKRKNGYFVCGVIHSGVTDKAKATGDEHRLVALHGILLQHRESERVRPVTMVRRA